MRPRRTYHSNGVYRLDGGTEDNDLWVLKDTDAHGSPIIRSTWVPTDDERQRIAAGENIEVIIWGRLQPPLALELDDSPLGRRPDAS